MAPTSGDRDRDRGRDRDRHRDRDRDWDRERDGNGGGGRGPSDMHHFGSSKDSEHEFNFQADKRLPQDRNRGGDSYRPGDRYGDDRGGKGGGAGGDRDRREWGRDRHRDRDRDDRRGRDHRDRGRNGGPSWGGRPGGFGGGEWKPKIPVPAHSRPMMLYKREKTPEQLEGMVSSGIYSETANAEEAADVDEEGSVQMELDEDGDNDDVAGGGGVVAEAGVLVETSVVVPVEDIKEGEEAVKAEKMKMDVIAMIRKAKGKPTMAAPMRNEVAANDDFISFGLSDDEKEKENHVTEDRGLDEDHGRKSRRGNDGKRVDALPLQPPPSTSRDKVFNNQDKFGQPLDEAPPPPPPPPHLSGMDIGPPGASGTLISSNLPPPPGLSTLPIGPKAPETNSSAVQGGIVFSLPAKPPPPASAPITPNLSTWPPPAHIATDVISISSSPTPPPQFAGHGKKRKHDETSFATHITPAGLAPEYMIPRNAQRNPTPWLLHDHSRTLHPSDMLHKEIHDFMMYIRPRRYEHAVRRHVIHRVRKAITNSLYDVDVRVFGSFPAEIYLPTSDIDLAVISRDFARSGMPKYNTKNTLFRVSNLLRKAKIPKDDKVAVIHTAKVPIIKFVDRLSGLQIDICFENLSGVTANRTYKRWREEYPAMPALAMVIKHFLELRKQNEVYVGGLGGFTVVCLVISLFQLHPGFSTGNIPIEKNLGVGLMEFLDLYGHRFDLSKVGIDVATASYFRKPYLPPPRFGVDTKSREYKDYWLLHITDPNDPDNNVSKSSYGVKDIFRTFADGFKALEDRMRTIHYAEFGERKGGVLGAILGGNYDAIEKQRATMRRLYQEVFKEKAVEDEYYGELDGVEDDDGLWRWEWEEAEQPPQGEDEGGEGWVVDVKGVGVGGGTLSGKQNDREKKEEKEAKENEHKNEQQPEYSSTRAGSKAKSPKRKGAFPVGNSNDAGGRGGGGGKKSRNFQKKHRNKA